MKIIYFLLLLLVGCANKYQELHDSLDDALTIIEDLYPEQLDMAKVRISMLQGIIGGVDPNGYYLNETQIKTLLETVEGNELKLGIEVSKHEDGVIVKKVFAKSPSELAGLKEKDIIISLDGKSLKDIILGNFPNLIKENKICNLVVNRCGNNIAVNITPGHFTYPTIETKWFENVAYFKIGCISKDSTNELNAHLLTIKQNPKLSALILDLRDSPGGSFQAGVDIAAQFLDGSVIVEMQKKDGLSKISSSGPDVLNKLPIFILQNKNTCSAAEIISAALKTHKRAKIIGENSSGVATAKFITKYPNKSDGLIISIAFLNDPNGKRIAKDGVQPDILIKETKIQNDKTSDLYIEGALKFVSAN